MRDFSVQDETYILNFLNKLTASELQNLAFHLKHGWTPSVPENSMPSKGAGCLNVLYQTRELSPEVWDLKKNEMRARVCELVGVKFDEFRRPTSRKYLHQLAVIHRMTKQGTIKGVLEKYFQNKGLSYVEE